MIINILKYRFEISIVQNKQLSFDASTYRTFGKKLEKSQPKPSFRNSLWHLFKITFQALSYVVVKNVDDIDNRAYWLNGQDKEE